MKLSIPELLRLVKDSKVDQRGINVIGICPSCNFSEWGISIYEKNHPFGCYRKKKCGFSGNIYTLLNFLKIHIDERVEYKEIIGTIVIQNKSATFDSLISFEEKLPLGFKYVEEHKYLKKRGFDFEDYIRYPVGTTQIDPKFSNHYVLFPVFMQHKVRGYVGRSIYSKQFLQKHNEISAFKIKRYNNSITDFGKLLYGYDELEEGDTVFLVEGIFSKRALDIKLNLTPGCGFTAICTFGAKISDDQISLLKEKKIEDIVLLHESDALKELKKNGFKLLPFFKKVRVGYTNKKDPEELSKEELYSIISSLKTPSQIETDYITSPF